MNLPPFFKDAALEYTDILTYLETYLEPLHKFSKFNLKEFIETNFDNKV
jgi:hypothetical protein